MIFVAGSIDFWQTHKRCAWCGGAMRSSFRSCVCSMTCLNAAERARGLIVRAVFKGWHCDIASETMMEEIAREIADELLPVSK